MSHGSLSWVRAANLGGMDRRVRPNPLMAHTVRDLVWHADGMWVDGYGYGRIVPDHYDKQFETWVNAFDGYDRVESLHWYAEGNGAVQWMLWEGADGSLQSFNGSTAPSVPGDYVRDRQGTQITGNSVDRSRSVVNTPWRKTMSMVWGRLLYLVNGLDTPLVFNGRYVEEAGFTGPSAPPEPQLVYTDITGGGSNEFATTLAELGLGNTVSSGTITVGYKYKAAPINERGQMGPVSAASAAVVWSQGSARAMVYVAMGDAPGSAVGWVVWRTRNMLDSDGKPVSLGRAENFYYHSYIPAPCDSFEDILPDNALGDLLDESVTGPWPDGATFLAEYKGVMLAGGSSDHMLWVSTPGAPEQFPVDNRLPVGDQSSGGLVGAWPMKNACIIFKERAIYLVKGDPTQGLYVWPLSSRTGCIAPKTIQEVPNVGVVFLGRDGVWALKGALENSGTVTEPVKISTPISDLLEEVNWSAAVAAVGATFHTAEAYWLAVPQVGKIRPTRLLQFHYLTGAWSYSDDWPVSDMIVTGDHRGYLFFGSHDNGDNAGIMQASRGWMQKGDVDLAMLYETAPLAAGMLWEAAVPRQVSVFAETHGKQSMVVDLRLNRHWDTVLKAEKMLDGVAGRRQWMRDEGRPGATYTDEITFDGTAYWDQYREVTIDMAVTALDQPHAQEVQLRFSSTGRRFGLSGYELGLANGAARKVTPLAKATANLTS